MRVHKGVALLVRSPWSPSRAAAAQAAAAVPAAGGSSGSSRSGGGNSAAAGTPKRGGTLTIARIEDSQSFDKTNVFQNESIWLTEQINESLYTVAQDGKTLKPWLATSYTKAGDGQTYTFKLRHGRQVLERPADDVRGRQVLDRRRPRTDEGLGLPRRGDQERSRRPTRRRSCSTSSTVGAVRGRHRACSPTGSSRRTSRASRARSSTSIRSAPARSCGTRASSASR